MAQFDKTQTFRESINMVDATAAVEQPVIQVASGGATLQINPNNLPAATSIGGLVAFGQGFKRNVVRGTSDVTVAATASGTVYISTKTSATQTFTLPAAATAGLEYRFVCTSAASEMLINVQTGDNIQLKATTDQGASVVTAASTGCKNTAATNVVGDSITLVSDGVTTWIATSQSGIWATQ